VSISVFLWLDEYFNLLVVVLLGSCQCVPELEVVSYASAKPFHKKKIVTARLINLFLVQYFCDLIIMLESC
jgi:hypothetical protein